MSLPVRKFREMVLQLLFSYDIAQPDEEALIRFMMSELEVTKRSVKEAQAMVRQILSVTSQLDELIAKTSTAYDFSRIQAVERNILRLGVFEMTHQDIPPKVAISEAIRLARKFSTPEAGAFINAILDHLYRQKLGEQPDDLSIKASYEEMLHVQLLAEKALELRDQNPEPPLTPLP